MSAMRITAVGDLTINDIGKTVVAVTDGQSFTGMLTILNGSKYSEERPPIINLTLKQGTAELALKGVPADYTVHIEETTEATK